jgi:CheY-like chemotaxis protein
MSYPVETATGFIAVVTSMTDKNSLFVPGMEAYFSTFPVVVFKSPKQLLDQLNRSLTLFLPSLIVMDITQSPDVSLAVLRELKASERFQSIPVLMRRVSRGVSRSVLAPANRSLEVRNHTRFNWEKHVANDSYQEY